MQEIAAAVGISAPALYRHFPNKYALFVRTASALARQLIAATEDAAALPLASVDDARAALDALLDAVILTTIDRRATGGIHRWEGRYLEDRDRRELEAELGRLRARLETAHAAWRPALAAEHRSTVVRAALSVVDSLTAHHTTLSTRALRALLKDAGWRVLDADPRAAKPLSGGERRGDAPARRNASTPRRQQLIDAAVEQFAHHGYHEVTIEAVASAVDLTPSGLYRHFAGKADLLLAACERGAAELDDATRPARESTDPPGEALEQLVERYVSHAFLHPALVRVYFADLGGLPSDDGRRLRARQRAHLADWVTLLQGARPELSAREATVLVHAALGIVADQTSLRRDCDVVAAGRVAHLVAAALGI